MSLVLPDEARGWQRRVREFVDGELLPWEVHAEMHAGELPVDIAARHREAARALGLHAIDTPRRHGGLELPTLTQAVIWEGTSEIQRLIVARALARRGSTALPG